MTPKQESQKRYRENNREKIAAIQRKHYRKRVAANPNYNHEQNYKFRINNPEKYLFQNAKARAKADGYEFDLELSDIIIPSICPVLMIPIFVQAGKGKQPNSPSVDRIDSSKGYVKGNIQVISWRANDLKADGTLEEFEKLTEFLRNAKKTRL